MEAGTQVAEARTQTVVHGRNVVVPDHYRDHVSAKLAKLERYDGKIVRTDVELIHEKNPRHADRRQRIEITCRTRGPVVRAEACAEDFYKALDAAVEKLERRLRQAADRRRVHRGRHTPQSITAVAADAATLDTLDGAAGGDETDWSGRGQPGDLEREPDGPGQLVRIKEHPAEPISVDDALLRMELVGHDFYLFRDADTGRASVVYRRHAYDYGLIRLRE